MINHKRRKFLQLLGLSSISMVTPKHVFSGNSNSEKSSGKYSSKPADEMRPGEIIEAIKKGSYAYVPVSPTFEWHSYHLPMGTDSLIPEELSRRVAEETGGIWFRPLSLGLDAWRDPKEKEMWGFKPEEEVFGMNFPEIPLDSEYCTIEDMKKIVRNRVKAVLATGVKHIFLVNHHGGKGQFKTLDELADELTTSTQKVHSLKTYQFNSLTKEDGWFGTGGHAGCSESTWLLAFRPDLIDLNHLPTGELSVREMGILHSKPTIEERWNPHNISIDVADKLRKDVVNNFLKYVKEL